MRLLLHAVDGEHPTLAQLEMAPDGGDLADAAESLERRCRAVEVPLAGGAARILGDPATEKSPELFAEVAREIDARDGRVLLTQGMGIDGADMVAIRKGTPHVLGLPVGAGGSGDPSPFTALGAFAAIRACLDDLPGKRISVLGVGRVGSRLVALLTDAGAVVTVADREENVAHRVAESHGAAMVAPDELLTLEGDLLSPNGRGPVLDQDGVDTLRYRFVAGAANGQLSDPRLSVRISSRGIGYVPEIFAGSGWLLNLAAELEPGGYDPRIAGEMCLRLIPRVREYLGREP